MKENIKVICSSKSLADRLSVFLPGSLEDITVSISKDKIEFKSDLDEIQVRCQTIDKDNVVLEVVDFQNQKLTRLMHVLKYVEEQPIVLYFDQHEQLNINFVI